MEEETFSKKPKKNWPKIVGFSLIGLLLLSGAFYAGMFYEAHWIAIQKALKILTPTIAPLPTLTPTPESKPLPTLLPPSAKDLDAVKGEIEKIAGPDRGIELIAISPSDHALVAYTDYGKNWSDYGIYLYDRKTKNSKKLWFFNNPLIGRGAYYMDNLNMEFSPTGEAFFLNKTGTNLPAFFIFDSEGNLFYQSRDLGHATWVNGQELLFLSAQSKQPMVFDIKSKNIYPSNLPGGLFHLKANKAGNAVMAFSLPKNALDCNSFDLFIYTFPEGIQVKSISNVSLDASWKTRNSFTYNKVEGCYESAPPSMVPYSSILSEPKVEFVSLP